MILNIRAILTSTRVLRTSVKEENIVDIVLKFEGIRYFMTLNII